MSSEIFYIDLETGEKKEEKVYGEGFIKWLYQTSSGQGLSGIVCGRPLSQAYGFLQGLSWSKRKVEPFIEKFSIDMESFEPAHPEGSHQYPYANFNEFFIRKYKDGLRNFPTQESDMGAFAEGRYFAWNEINDDIKFPVKGKDLSYKGIIGNDEIAKDFEGGPLLISRLCPVDYHRYHYPDDGELVDRYRIRGDFHSVNPMALAFRPDIFLVNEREVSILDTKNFGKLAYVEVGAVCVGKIIQSHKEREFRRGQEKGYFLFGGSTVILIGEPGKWKVRDEIIQNTNNSIESYVKLGGKIGEKL